MGLDFLSLHSTMAKGMHPLMAELRDMSMSGEELVERCLPLALIVLSITLTEHTVCIPRSQPWLHEPFGGHWEVGGCDVPGSPWGTAPPAARGCSTWAELSAIGMLLRFSANLPG